MESYVEETRPGSSFSYHNAKRELGRRYWGDDVSDQGARLRTGVMDRDDGFRL